jgi:quercetin dioxygenase-like cupin family protein
MDPIIAMGQLPGSEIAHQFVGADHGNVPVSFFLVHSSPGEGPKLHRHPYPEVFIVTSGEATFVVGEQEIIGRSGDILIAPAGAPHCFKNTGEDELRLTAIHTASRMQSEWLEA